MYCAECGEPIENRVIKRKRVVCFPCKARRKTLHMRRSRKKNKWQCARCQRKLPAPSWKYCRSCTKKVREVNAIERREIKRLVEEERQKLEQKVLEEVRQLQREKYGMVYLDRSPDRLGPLG